jgi:hypothetical protein
LSYLLPVLGWFVILPLVDHHRLRSRDSFINESLEASGLRRGVQRRPGPGLRILDFRFGIWIAGTLMWIWIVDLDWPEQWSEIPTASVPVIQNPKIQKSKIGV